MAKILVNTEDIIIISDSSATKCYEFKYNPRYGYVPKLYKVFKNPILTSREINIYKK